MAVIDITTEVYLSEKDVLIGFVNLTNSKNSLEPFDRMIGTVKLLHHVLDAELLGRITEHLEQKGFVISSNILMQLDEIEIGNYTGAERSRLQAAIYSVSYSYQLLVTQSEIFDKAMASEGTVSTLPKFSLKVIGTQIYHNLDEISTSFKRRYLLYLTDQRAFYTKGENNKSIKFLINILNDIQFRNGTVKYDEEIKYLERLLQYSPDENVTVRPEEKHEHVFANDGFLLFQYILSKYVAEGRGRKSDIAYYYWRMFNDSRHYIHKRPEAFKEWFFKQYGEDIGKLKTLVEVRNKQRDNNYNDAYKWHNSR